MRRFRIGLLAVLALVLLRLTIGWHFLHEGVWKLQNPSFSAEGFLRQSRGPLKDKFTALIPDYDGLERLNSDSMRTKWDDFRRELKGAFDLNQDQQSQTMKIFTRYEERLQTYLAENQEDIAKYLEGLKALKTKRDDPATDDVPYLRDRLAKEESELRGQAAAWLAYIDGLDESFRDEALSVVDADQRQRGKLPEHRTQMDRIDRLTSYGIAAIGLCLMLGFLTRISSLAGGLFLLSVVLAHPNYPGVFPAPHPSGGHPLFVSKEVVEMMALFALATLPVGRWLGLDFIVHYGLIRPLFSRRKDHASHA